MHLSDTVEAATIACVLTLIFPFFDSVCRGDHPQCVQAKVAQVFPTPASFVRLPEGPRRTQQRYVNRRQPFCSGSECKISIFLTLFLVSGAYWHENFIKDDRDLCLTISRIKAPKRRMNSQNTKGGVRKAFLKSSQKTNAAQQLVFAPGFASSSGRSLLVQFNANTGSVSPDHLSSSTCHLGVQSGSHQQQGSEVETYQWLLNAGVPFSAFDPVALNDGLSITKVSSPELLDCADEITSLFANTSEPVSGNRQSLHAAPIDASMNASMPLLSNFQDAYGSTSAQIDNSVDDVPLPVSPSISSADQMPLSELLLGGGSVPNDDWALW